MGDRKSISEDTFRRNLDPIAVDIKDWSDQEEFIVARWADQAMCYKWMHERAQTLYDHRNRLLTFPAILLSTLTGTVNFGLSSIAPEEHQKYAQIGIGMVNIITAAFTTVQNFFKYAEATEAHRTAARGWGKLHRNIAIELALDRTKRHKVGDFIRVCRAEYERLVEMSPVIPMWLRTHFREKFSAEINDVILPDECDVIQHVSVYVDNASKRPTQDSPNTPANTRSSTVPTTPRRIYSPVVGNNTFSYLENDNMRSDYLPDTPRNTPTGPTRQVTYTPETKDNTPNIASAPPEHISRLFQNNDEKLKAAAERLVKAASTLPRIVIEPPIPATSLMLPQEQNGSQTETEVIPHNSEGIIDSFKNVKQ